MNITRHHHFMTGLRSSLGTLAMTVAIIGAAPAFAAKGAPGGGGAGGGGAVVPPVVVPPVTPAALPPDAIVFTMRDFVSISNLKADADLRIDSLRKDSSGMYGVVGTANAKTNSVGFVEVNHPGGVCWDKVTPDISSNDLIQVVYKSSGAVATQTLTQDVKASQAAIAGPDGGVYVEVKGTAQLANGARIDLSLLEVRIINPEFMDPTISRIGKRDIRADSTGGRIDDKNGKPISGTSGTLSYDTTNNPSGLNFTAKFLGLTATEQQLVVEGQTRIMGWAATDTAGNRLGVTIYEVGAFGGPGMGNCPPGPAGVVAASPLPANDLVTYNPALLGDAKTAPQPAVLTVFPDRDFVSITGLAAGTDLQVVVRRPKLLNGGDNPKPVIGMARGFANRAGVFEVNHPGGSCWIAQTPDIGPDDYIDMVIIPKQDPVTGLTPAATGQKQRVINTKVTKTAGISSNQVFVSGMTVDEIGANYDWDFIEQRIVNPDFTTTPIGTRDITADTGVGRVPGGTGIIAKIPTCLPGSIACTWKAAYTFDPNFAAVEQNIAVAGQSRSLAWLGVFNGVRSGITISEFGELGGPGMGNCPARGFDSVALP